MIKKTCTILALAALPFLVTPAAQADTRFGLWIGSSDIHDARHHRGHRVKKHHRRHRGHKRHRHGRKASLYIVSPASHATRHHLFGHGYRRGHHRHRISSYRPGRFCRLD